MYKSRINICTPWVGEIYTLGVNLPQVGNPCPRGIYPLDEVPSWQIFPSTFLHLSICPHSNSSGNNPGMVSAAVLFKQLGIVNYCHIQYTNISWKTWCAIQINHPYMITLKLYVRAPARFPLYLMQYFSTRGLEWTWVLGVVRHRLH